jgi:glycosyltransferase involved in cell wall biosynthesis
LGLQKVVHFLGTRHDVPELLAASDLLVLPSISEGLSMTLIEGSAAGLPLVASDVGGNNELVEHGINGLLVPVSNPDALANALITIIADEAQARLMGKASQRRFHKYFDIKAMISHYQALYDSHPIDNWDKRQAGYQ